MALDFSKYRNWRQIEKDIHSISIQGARNVTRGSLHEIRLAMDEYKGKDMVKNLIKISSRLMDARPTEPMTRAILSGLKNHSIRLDKEEKDPRKIKARMGRSIENIEEMMKESMKSMAEIGSNYIENGTAMMTYCHSSSGTNIIKKAHDKGKIAKVFVCETRPLYQGRITASELSSYGIDTYLIVDGAMATYAKKADMAMVGADAITSTGDLINKIGSCSLSMVFKAYSKPFVSAAEALKYDPDTSWGFNEKIEQRKGSEIWEKAPKRLKMLNPAFDQTHAGNIEAYITDVGICSSENIEGAYNKA
ncbi:MAG: hypothetical protein NTY68_02230 [Candidatus Micrarchaeota archaeon]|nr:hypothetical protein [Candidatus Micrarchaeota archaeon]